jgi:hypothetical protein
MTADLPPYYFRIRDNGAAVFRVETDARNRRVEMEPIAVVNVKTGDIRAQGDRVLSQDDMAAIRDWTIARQDLLARRDIDDIHRAIDHMNLTAAWAQSKATDAQLDAVTDALLLAMHDLRTVLVRKKADRMGRGSESDKEE